MSNYILPSNSPNSILSTIAASYHDASQSQPGPRPALTTFLKARGRAILGALRYIRKLATSLQSIAHCCLEIQIYETKIYEIELVQ